MHSSDYDFEINCEDDSLTHTKILKYVPEDSTVLEAGCGRGNLTAYMRNVLNCRVSIVEYSQVLYDHAIQFAENGYCGNLEEDAWLNVFKGQTFDVIMFADVLEHLRDPDAVLQKAMQFINPNGIVIISIPNVCHNDVIISMLQNDFHYTKEGLLDNTHIRFYGLNNVESLLDNAALQIEDMTFTFCETFKSELQIDNTAIPTQIIDLLAQRQSGEIYQFIIKAKLKSSTRFSKELHSMFESEVGLPEILPYKLAYITPDDFNDIQTDHFGRMPLNKDITKKFVFNGVAVKRFHFIIQNILSCYLQDFSVKINDEEVYPYPQNGSQVFSLIFFDNVEPSFIIENLRDQAVSSLVISLKVVLLSNTNMQFLAKTLVQSISDYIKLQQNSDLQISSLRELYETALKDVDFLLFTCGTLREEIAKQTDRSNSLEAELSSVPKFLRLIFIALRSNRYTRFLLKVLRHFKAYGLITTVRKSFRYLKHKIKEPQLSADIECLDYMFFKNTRILESDSSSIVPISMSIDIVVPIYNGYELLMTLLKCIDNTRMQHRVILIDDYSTDKRISPILEQYKVEHPTAILLRNERNLGFVETVNRGLRCSSGHVALVNTDVELPANWLERLMQPIIQGNRIASSTPFTNSGTICSFPKFLEDNELYCKLDLATIDAAFSMIKPAYPIIPTGVGFCMGMHCDAIREIGLLDHEAFGRGYCEENDWCQRAIAQNWNNVIVDNLFVYHKHGGSFASSEKQLLIKKNLNTLLSRYPNYEQQIHDYCLSDPLKSVRQWVQVYLQSHFTLNPVVVFSHSWGGGAHYYLEKKYLENFDRTFLTISPSSTDSEKYYLTAHWRGESACCYFNDLKQCLSILPDTLDEIWINELVSYRNLSAKIEIITDLASKKNARLRFLLHDFFCICPSIVLLDSEGCYCSPSVDSVPCANCIRVKNQSLNSTPFEKTTQNMLEWRIMWNDFLKQCDVIEAFSNSSKDILLSVYPSLLNIVVNPHTVESLRPVSRMVNSSSHINIGVLGVLQYQKGLNIIRDMVSIIDSRRLPVSVKIIGTSYEPISGKSFSQTGAYLREDLPRIVEDQRIDIIFIASIWPETYSFTTDEAILMGLPVACFDLGAPPERIRKYSNGLVISKIDAECALNEILDFLKVKANEQSN